MAPLPFNNTSILFLDYTTCGYQHTLQVRFGGDVPETEAETELAAFLASLGNSHRLMTINGCRYLPEGQNISVEVPWNGATTYGTGAGTANETAQFYDFIGRSATGRRTRISIYGAITKTYQEKFRAPEGSDPAFAAGINELNTGEGTFLAVDGGQPIWKRYVNLGENAYWRNRVR